VQDGAETGGGAGGGGVTRATSHRRTLDCNPRHIENLGQCKSYSNGVDRQVVLYYSS